MVAPKKVRTLTVFLIDILCSHKLDKMESAIIKVVPFSQVLFIRHSWLKQVTYSGNKFFIFCKQFFELRL